MKRQDFINELRLALANLPAAEREDILRDQEEYLHEAELAGRNEEEVIQALGDPRQLAVSLNVEAKIHQVEKSKSFSKQIVNTFSAVLAILALAPFNFLFVLWPFLIFSGLSTFAWMLAGGTLIFSVAGLGIFLFKLVFINVGVWTHLSALFMAIGWVGIGVLSLLFMAKWTKVFLFFTVRYLKWNLQIIKGKA